MKKIFLSLGLLIVMLSFCIFTTWRVHQICDASTELLRQAETQCRLGDYEGAGETVHRSQSLWKSHEGFLGLALRHTESDDVDVLYPPLLEICRQKDQQEFLRKNQELIATLKQLSHMEIPYLYNIL